MFTQLQVTVICLTYDWPHFFVFVFLFCLHTVFVLSSIFIPRLHFLFSLRCFVAHIVLNTLNLYLREMHTFGMFTERSYLSHNVFLLFLIPILLLLMIWLSIFNLTYIWGGCGSECFGFLADGAKRRLFCLLCCRIPGISPHQRGKSRQHSTLSSLWTML